MIHNAKYKGSRPCGFRQEDISSFPHINIGKTGHASLVTMFSTYQNNVNSFGRG